MADIENQYRYTEEDEEAMEMVKQNPGYSHDLWSSEVLQALRSNIRGFYRNEQRGVCAFCKNEISLQAAANCTIEHIIPKSKCLEFMFHPKNLCVICADCNQIKRAQEIINELPNVLNDNRQRIRYPTASRTFKIVHPHFDIWNEHIIRLGRGYIDKSKKGGNTILICNLNRFFHLFEVGEEYIADADLSELMNEYLTCVRPIRKAEILLQIKAALR
ncbi:hypothetical protein HZI30_21555 [Serratia fonticola]|uniref:HNH endonuclease n=1 Tax=Serratia fonticola TaxID=47917 RepID=UPI0015C5F025|nr:HNH endonuclease domain-containing protein [Serratia fonticola]NXZ89522.1 hypothetical protein [Serratia fonticola]